MPNPVPSSRTRIATMRVENKAFVREMERISKKLAQDEWPALVNEVAVAFLQGVIPKTPVATMETSGYVGGRARAGWYMAASKLGAKHTSEGAPENIAIGRSEGECIKKLSDKDYPHIIIVNGVPYVLILEYGYSNQAPAGMARITMREIRKMFAKGIPKAIKKAVAR